MGSYAGQIFPIARLHRDHSISYALVCEKSLSYMDTHGGLLYSPTFVHARQAVSSCKNICICHEFEGGIEKSVPRITDWHHEACRMMTIGDHEGLIFLSHPHTHKGYFLLLTTKYLILYYKDIKTLPEKPEFAEMRHGDVILTLQ